MNCEGSMSLPHEQPACGGRPRKRSAVTEKDAPHSAAILHHQHNPPACRPVISAGWAMAARHGAVVATCMAVRRRRGASAARFFVAVVEALVCASVCFARYEQALVLYLLLVNDEGHALRDVFDRSRCWCCMRRKHKTKPRARCRGLTAAALQQCSTLAH